jgi:hypothetical protein
MKNIIKLALVVILGFGAVGYSNTGDLKSLILEIYPGFCDSGTFKRTIRSGAGKYCTTDIGAALASLVCTSKILENTDCAKTKGSQLKKVKGSQLKKVKKEKDWDTTITIDEIIELDECKFLAKEFPKIHKQRCLEKLNF